MNELVTVTADWFRELWADGPADDPPEPPHEYIVGPEPLPDDWYDEGGCD